MTMAGGMSKTEKWISLTRDLDSMMRGCWRIVNGAVDFGCTGVVDSEYGW